MTYRFDVKLFASIEVDAESEDEARRLVEKAFDEEITMSWRGEYLDFSTDGVPDLVED